MEFSFVNILVNAEEVVKWELLLCFLTTRYIPEKPTNSTNSLLIGHRILFSVSSENSLTENPPWVILFFSKCLYIRMHQNTHLYMNIYSSGGGGNDTTFTYQQKSKKTRLNYYYVTARLDWLF